ncbi:unnamed protein product [Dovyalis caffra]|uniref:Uncharacterized protein n=1 Tax=Dovyalis caffra TaxID=77055 RepID=A0AAV1S2X9_9ROSI|nr:unnamed protein product [Dovyalis caffra]
MANSEGDSGTTSASCLGEDDHVSVDVDSLTSSFENMMSQNSLKSTDCCIFKVPNILRRHSKKAYVPNGFSIGPWHHNNPNLKGTKNIKVRYLDDLLSEAPSGKPILKELIRAIKETEKEARQCYAGPIGEATRFFNQLYHDSYLTEYHYANECKEVNKYCRQSWPRWRAVLMRNYFGTPWKIASLFVAAAFLILTIVQTIFSIIKK